MGPRILSSNRAPGIGTRGLPRSKSSQPSELLGLGKVATPPTSSPSSQRQASTCSVPILLAYATTWGFRYRETNPGYRHLDGVLEASEFLRTTTYISRNGYADKRKGNVDLFKCRPIERGTLPVISSKSFRHSSDLLDPGKKVHPPA